MGVMYIRGNMALFNNQIRMGLEHLINVADIEIRTDFHDGYLVDENDYTSNLTSHIRRIVNTHLPLRVTTVSQKLPANMEQVWGVDACIILIDHDTSECKLCLFEAKSDRKNWDYIKSRKTSAVSHFSTQLARQVTPFKMGFVIWEQFYSSRMNGISVGKRNNLGSTCILHSNAITHNGTHPNSNVWTDKDIDHLATKQIQNTMGSLVKITCECNLGVAKSISELLLILEGKLPVKEILFVEGGRIMSRGENHPTIANKYITSQSNRPPTAAAD
jgi:hypothetical protein